jgi:hypothetical protein
MTLNVGLLRKKMFMENEVICSKVGMTPIEEKKREVAQDGFSLCNGDRLIH